MKKYIGTFSKIGFYLIIALVLLDFIIGFSLQHKDEITHRIAQPGDSVSLLAFKEYKQYNAFLDRILRGMNSHLEDFNQLATGDTVYFPAISKVDLHIERFRFDGVDYSTPKESLKTQSNHAVLTHCKGTTLFKKATDSLYALAKANMLFGPGDFLQTGGDGYMELGLDQKSILRIGPHSILEIVELDLSHANREKSLFYFNSGNIWIQLRKILGNHSYFNVQFPTAIAGVQGTNYRAEVAADSSAAILVYKGSVAVRRATQREQTTGPRQVPGPQEITLEAWTQLVRANQAINISPEGEPDSIEEIPQNDAEIQWVRWNRQRDERMFSR